MGDDLKPGKVAAISAQVFGGESLVHHAVSVVENDLFAGLRSDPFAKVLVGKKDHAIRIERFYDFDRIGRCAANVRLRLDVGVCVDIGDDGNARILRFQFTNVFAGDRFGERAPGAQIGNQNRFIRIKDLRRLRHEEHAGLNDHLRLGFGGAAGKTKRVADEVGDSVVDVRSHVGVREYDRVALLLELFDPLDEWLDQRDFRAGHYFRKIFKGDGAGHRLPASNGKQLFLFERA